MTQWCKRVSTISLLVFLTACWSEWNERAARSGTVRGKVVSTTGQSIPSTSILYVPIAVPGVTAFEEKGIQTGSQGGYAMVLPAGTYDIYIQTPHGRQSQRVTVIPGQVTVADFTIDRSHQIPHLGLVSHCAEAVPVATRALGEILGQVGIGMSAEELRQVMGEPMQVISMPNIAPLQWVFADGTRITFSSANETNVVAKISTRSPMLGTTAEGLSIGDTIDNFGRIYQDFAVCSHTANNFLVIGDNDRWLGVGFSEDERVSGLTVTAENPRPGQRQDITKPILRQ